MDITQEINFNEIDSILIQDALLNDSRITPSGNGNPNSRIYYTQPTSGQKWWAAVLLGFLFALISSPAAYNITSKVILDDKIFAQQKVNLTGLFIHTIIFIIIVRIILW